MEFYWNPWAVPGIVAGLLAIAAGFFVYFAAPGGQLANRRLALVLVLEGVMVGTGAGLIYIVDSSASTYAAQAVSITAALALPFLYLWFLGVLGTRLSPILEHIAFKAALLVSAIAVQVWWFMDHDAFIRGVQADPGYANARWDAIYGPAYSQFQVYFVPVIYTLALVVSILAFRSATSTIARRRAKAFMIAFGVRDAAIIVFKMIAFAPALLTTGGEVAATGGWVDYALVIGYPIMMAIFLPMLALGILRTQLFDIDFKIKVTINRGSVISVYMAAFFVVSKLIENYVGANTNLSWLGGGVITGLLLFALNPLQQAAERFTTKAMPGAKPVGALAVDDRLELYREQLEFAFADGRVNKKERMLLEHLRQRLGLEKAQAMKLEERFHKTGGRPTRRTRGVPSQA